MNTNQKPVVHRYPLFYTIICAAFPSFMLFIIIMMFYGLITEGVSRPVEKLSDYVFFFGIYGLLPLPLLFLAYASLYRLQYSFIRISVWEGKHFISFQQLGKKSECYIKELKSISDSPNKGVLILHTASDTIKIPKEVNDYPLLYEFIRESRPELFRALPEEFLLKAGIGVYFIRVLLFILSLVPCSVLISLLFSISTGQSNNWMLLFTMLVLSIGMVGIFIFLNTHYSLGPSGITTKNILATRTYAYSNLQKLEFDAMHRTLTLQLKHDPYKFLRKLNGESGIKIREPRNASLEELTYHISERMKKATTLAV